MHVETQPLCITHPKIEGLSVVVWGDTTVRSINLFDGEPEALRDELNELYPVGVTDIVTVLGKVVRGMTDQSVYLFIAANPCSGSCEILHGHGQDYRGASLDEVQRVVGKLLDWKLIGPDVDGGYSMTYPGLFHFPCDYPLFDPSGNLVGVVTVHHLSEWNLPVLPLRVRS